MDKAKRLLVTSYSMTIVSRKDRVELNIIQKPHKQSKAIYIRGQTKPEKVVLNYRDSKEEGQGVTVR